MVPTCTTGEHRAMVPPFPLGDLESAVKKGRPDVHRAALGEHGLVAVGDSVEIPVNLQAQVIPAT